MTELDAYAADCRLFGEVDLADGRLTDLLNATSELRIVDARLESLLDGHVVRSPELIVARDELYAVVAAGLRGDTARRLRTNAINVVVDLGRIMSRARSTGPRRRIHLPPSSAGPPGFR